MNFVIDNNVILDVVFERGQFREKIKLLNDLIIGNNGCIPAAALHQMQYVVKKNLPKKEEQFFKLIRKFKIIKTPSYVDFEHPFALLDLEDYLVDLSARSIGAQVITSDRQFLDNSDITIHPDEYFDIKRDAAVPKPFIDLKNQYCKIASTVEKNIDVVLNHGRYILGPEVKELENQLINYTKAKHCITVSSGTDALLMPLMAWDIGPGDAVFTTPFTFIATAEVIQLLGATPVFVDIDPQTFNIDPKKLALAIEAVEKNDPQIHPFPQLSNHNSSSLRPKAIIPVDLFGLPADYDPIMEIAAQYDLLVLSDSAQGFGGEYKGQKTGNFGHATTTSFFPAKPLGCYGDGGAIFTNNNDLADKLESIRVHGKGKDKYDNIRIGLNARLHTMQAAILLAKLQIFPRELETKQKIAEQYSTQLSSQTRLIPPYTPQKLRSAWAQYSILAKTTELRDEIQTALKAKNIPSMVYYATPLHIQTAFVHLNYEPNDFPISMDIAKRIFSLPMHAYLNEQTIEQITATINQSIK